MLIAAIEKPGIQSTFFFFSMFGITIGTTVLQNGLKSRLPSDFLASFPQGAEIFIFDVSDTRVVSRCTVLFHIYLKSHFRSYTSSPSRMSFAASNVLSGPSVVLTILDWLGVNFSGSNRK